jgi:preprotein translocase subunit YajC
MVGSKENDMAWKLLFGSDIGLLSLFTIVFIICMAIYLIFFVRNRMREDERQEQLRQLKR